MVHQTKQGAALDRKKLMADPIMVTTIVLLITLLTLFILYPLAILLVDSFVGDGSFSLSVFQRIFQISSFKRAITICADAALHRRTFQSCFYVAGCFSAVCSVSLHDYAVWQSGYYYEVLTSYL